MTEAAAFAILMEQQETNGWL